MSLFSRTAAAQPNYSTFTTQVSIPYDSSTINAQVPFTEDVYTAVRIGTGSTERVYHPIIDTGSCGMVVSANGLPGWNASTASQLSSRLGISLQQQEAVLWALDSNRPLFQQRRIRGEIQNPNSCSRRGDYLPQLQRDNRYQRLPHTTQRSCSCCDADAYWNRSYGRGIWPRGRRDAPKHTRQERFPQRADN